MNGRSKTQHSRRREEGPSTPSPSNRLVVAAVVTVAVAVAVMLHHFGVVRNLQTDGEGSRKKKNCEVQCRYGVPRPSFP